jgi:hypothetical protein
MRVRPFFWLFLVFVCIGILAFSATVQILVPARLLVQLEKRPLPETPTTLKVHVTDVQGVTVDGAQITSQAWMTNMHMVTDATSTTAEGQGTYLVQIRLYMAGPWIITVKMQANGFLPLRQTLLVQVQSTPASAYLFAQPLSGNGSERASAFTSLPSLSGFPQ